MNAQNLNWLYDLLELIRFHQEHCQQARRSIFGSTPQDPQDSLFHLPHASVLRPVATRVQD